MHHILLCIVLCLYRIASYYIIFILHVSHIVCTLYFVTFHIIEVLCITVSKYYGVHLLFCHVILSLIVCVLYYHMFHYFFFPVYAFFCIITSNFFPYLNLIFICIFLSNFFLLIYLFLTFLIVFFFIVFVLFRHCYYMMHYSPLGELIYDDFTVHKYEHDDDI